MAAKLEAFLLNATQNMFQDLNVFVQSDLKVTREGLGFREAIPEDELRSGVSVGMVQDLGDGKQALLMIPLKAAVWLSGSMMFLPMEHINELMESGELDDEMSLTAHEIGNLLTGTFSRVAREELLYPQDVRLKELVVKPGNNIDHLPFVNDVALVYHFKIRTERGDIFQSHLCLPEESIYPYFPSDPLVIEAKQGNYPSGTTPPASKPKVVAPEPSPNAWDNPSDSIGASSSENGAPFNQFSQQPPPNSWNQNQQSVSGQNELSSWPDDPSSGYSNNSSDWMSQGSTDSASNYLDQPIDAYAKPNRRALAAVLTTPETEDHSDGSLVSARVLIVDDSWVSCRTLARFLIPHGCAIHDARDAITARQILREKQVDLILLDLMLPGENGLTFLSKLRSDGTTEHIPVVIVSGESTSENVVQAIRAGASFFLVKPVSEAYLIRVLRGVMRNYRKQTYKVANQTV